MKAIQPLSEVVNLDLSTDMPIKISPELDVGSLEFYIAPCIGVGDEPVRTVTEEKAYEQNVTGVSTPEDILVVNVPEETSEATTPEPVAPEGPAPEPVISEEPIPTPIPASIPEPAPTPMPIKIDMSVLRRLKL